MQISIHVDALGRPEQACAVPKVYFEQMPELRELVPAYFFDLVQSNRCRADRTPVHVPEGKLETAQLQDLRVGLEIYRHKPQQRVRKKERALSLEMRTLLM